MAVNIIRNQKKALVEFSEVPVGHTFLISTSDELWMKMRENGQYNAICLNDGLPGCVRDDEFVKPVDITIKVAE